MSVTDTAPTGRRALRQQLLARRASFASSPAYAPAAEALAQHLLEILAQLEPERLGVYWAVRSEFNPVPPLLVDGTAALKPAKTAFPLALPYCRREPREMHYRPWDGAEPGLADECGIPACDGAPVVPDVVLAPCVGHTRSGFRLGYGGGYFDRFLAAHPHAVAVGIAWSWAEIDEAALAPAAHDLPLACIVTEHGVLAPRALPC